MRVHSGVNGIHAVDIGKDMALPAQLGRKCNGGGIASSAPQCRDVTDLVRSLKARNHDNLVILQMLLQPRNVNIHDAGMGMVIACYETALVSGQGYRRYAQRINGHCKQGDGSLLTGGKQGIQLPLIDMFTNFLCHGNQLVGCLSHGTCHNDHLIPLCLQLRRMCCDCFNLCNRTDACSSILLYNIHTLISSSHSSLHISSYVSRFTTKRTLPSFTNTTAGLPRRL